MDSIFIGWLDFIDVKSGCVEIQDGSR